jgi:hypothetical protein
MRPYRLFMILVGCRPGGRNTEQHDVFFGIAKELRDLVPEIKAFWKGAGTMHLDGWRVVNNVDGYHVSISEMKDEEKGSGAKLFFLNLGGYKENYFEEFHYKMLTVATDKAEAGRNAKQTAFFLHTGFNKDAAAHIDDRFGVDVDDLFEIKDILSDETKSRFSVIVEKREHPIKEDEINLGYFKLDSL